MSDQNQRLTWLNELKEEATRVRLEMDKAKRAIREGFVERAIVFIDVSDSTSFKVANRQYPEVWILRIKQICDLISSAVTKCQGTVVKYIGDEVMATFANPNDAQNFVGRIPEIKASTVQAPNTAVELKVAADFGKVYELTFEGHETPDPQGTPVDRCARIAQYCTPGAVLASASFAQKTASLDWKKVGAADLKGLGHELVYQLGQVTVEIDEMIEITKREFELFQAERDENSVARAKLKEQNLQLQRQIEELGSVPEGRAVAGGETPSDFWGRLAGKVEDLQTLVQNAFGNPFNYARFLFLYVADFPSEPYGAFPDRPFDDLIESNIVEDVYGEERFSLNDSHPRNKRALAILAEIERELEQYQLENKPDPDDLFDWTIKAPELWEEYFDLRVTR